VARPATIEGIENALRECAMAYPEAYEEFPWGERAIKVNKKVFMFLSAHADRVSFSVKLPLSRDVAYALPFAEPTGYGLGKHGWVTAQVKPGDDIPLDMLMEWIDESYRAIAPKKLVAGLPEPGAASD
jgi:predicted DNA-binding protein (MmcQ/YjbR family)